MSRAALAAYVLVTVAVLAATAARLPYGADVQDEPMHLVSALRFADGADPFVDEILTSPQGTALLLAPAVALYEELAGREGIVLASRRLYFVFTLLVAAGLAVGLRSFVSRPNALLISLAAVAFVPFSLPEFHQNTLSSGLFALGCLLGIGAAVAGAGALRPALAGVAHGLAIFAYPFFAVGVLAFAAALGLLFPSRRRRTLAPYVVAAAVPVAALAAVALLAGLGNVADSYTYATDSVGQGGGVGKLLETARYRWAEYDGKLLTLVAVAAYFALRARAPGRARYLLALAPLLPLDPRALDGNAASVDYVANLALLGAPVALALWREDPCARRLFLGVWVPAIVAGIAVSWASSNDGTNFAIGSFPAALVTLALVVRALEPSGPLMPGVLLAATLAVLVVCQYTSVYRDPPVAELEAQVPSGPYEGIVTTPAKRRLILGLAADLRRIGGHSTGLLVYDDLPLGYLLSAAKPATNTAWTFHDLRPGAREPLLDHYSTEGELPDLVVRVRRVPLGEGEVVTLDYARNDPLDRLVQSRRYERVLTRRAYTIFRRTGA